MVFLSTPFSRAAAVRLEKFGVAAYKIGSGELNNLSLIHILAGITEDEFDALDETAQKEYLDAAIVKAYDTINASAITDPQRAQIEDIVKRKAEVSADQIIITLLNMAE